MYTELVFVGDRDTNTPLCLKLVLQEFDIIWMIHIDEQCRDF